MTKELLNYYNEELDYLRRAGNAFAEIHPKIAGTLRMGQHSAEDPFVERLIESFAFLTAKLNKQLDGDNIELAHTLLNLIYPHLLLPIPSITTLQFHPNEHQQKNIQLEKGTLLQTKTEDGTPYYFQTCYPLNVMPLKITEATLSLTTDLPIQKYISEKSKACIRLKLSLTHKESKLNSDSLRFYINAQKQYANSLYDLLFQHVNLILFYTPQQQQIQKLTNSTIHAVGFNPEHALFPYRKTSFEGFRLLTEYCVFPEKFMYFEINALKTSLTEITNNPFEIWLCLDQPFTNLKTAINEHTFQLGCTPAINLFEMQSEAITVDHMRSEYRIAIDKRFRPEAFEIYQVLSLKGWLESGENLDFKPLYGLKYGEKNHEHLIFWESKRKSAWRYGEKNRTGYEVELCFLDHSPELTRQPWTLVAKLTCTNRDLPSELPFGGDQPQFHLEGKLSGQIYIRCLKQPTPSIHPTLLNEQYWYLLATLISAHDSLIDQEKGIDHIKSILNHLSAPLPEECQRILDHMKSLSSKSVTTRFPQEQRLTFVRGTQITITFDDHDLQVSDVTFFGTVLNHFLNQYCAIDSFIELVFQFQHEGEITRWQPTFGEQAVI